MLDFPVNPARGLIIALVTAGVLLQSGCSKPQMVREYRAGDSVTTGPLTFNVVQTSWRSQLEAFPVARIPDRNFLLIHVMVTNGGGSEVSIPLLKLENTKGESFAESENGSGVDNWLGLLRHVSPAQSSDGWLLFDVPTNAYRLRVSDGDIEHEQFAYIDIPLSIPDR
jgi:hypothetical protein